MANVVKILRSTTAGNVPSSLVSGQIAINEKDGKLFWRDETSGQVYSVTINGLDTAVASKVSQTGATGAANLPSGTTAQRPTGSAGQLRYNSTTGKFEGYGSSWGNIGGGASISDTAPSNPGAGDLWWNSADGILYVYYSDGTSSQWVATDAGGEGQYVAYTDTGTVTTAMLANASVTQAKLGANVAGNGPAFSAYNSSATTINNTTLTKIAFQTEEFDTNNNFDNSTNYRFTPTVAGYYIVSGAVSFSATITTEAFVALYKKGLEFKRGMAMASCQAAFGSWLVYLDGSTDYIELWAFQNSGSSKTSEAVSTKTYFQASLVRAA